MAFKSIADVLAESGVIRISDHNANKPGGVYIGTTLQKKNKHKWRMSIRITMDICNEARLIAGDCVSMEVDKDEGLLRIFRVAANHQGKSWVLSAPHGGDRTSKSLQFTLTWVPGLPSFHTTARADATVGPEGIIVDVPDFATWDYCIRESESQADLPLGE